MDQSKDRSRMLVNALVNVSLQFGIMGLIGWFVAAMTKRDKLTVRMLVWVICGSCLLGFAVRLAVDRWVRF